MSELASEPQSQREIQATVATFIRESNSGTVLLDSGAELSFDAKAFARSGLRMFRLGQRVVLRVVGGQVVAITHICFPLH
ncbi:hypothetical protein [Actinokineospora sp.]|uniref:hypothetical protein n=1 Tax=Actinokineospora sp. TaxID=1872133 RepID=UPI0040377442